MQPSNLNLSKTSSKIRVCIVGVGNCASALIQGVTKSKYEVLTGVTFEDIGGYKVSDIEFVGAFDVDERKVGQPLNKAIYAKPNCCYNIFDCKDDNDLNQVKVLQAPRFDGVAPHMLKEDANHSFRPLPDTWDIAEINLSLIMMKPDVIINYLPVGSQIATEFWANMCLNVKIPFLNCIPVFIASDPEWEAKFIEKGLPLIGDDMRSQFGASVVSQMLEELALDRGHEVLCHIQQNSGGNTDFLNMNDKSRLVSKKISKENVLRASHEIKNVDIKQSYLHAGPSEYIEYYGDKKVANFSLELKGFGGAPVRFDAKLSVEDSPNSAGVVVDSIRFLKVAREMGLKGSLRGASAFTQKSPPEQLLFKDAYYECKELAARKLTDKTLKQI
jgi:myo-inositol-1-phosphate synthase